MPSYTEGQKRKAVDAGVGVGALERPVAPLLDGLEGLLVQVVGMARGRRYALREGSVPVPSANVSSAQK